MNPKYKSDDTIYYYLDTFEIVIKTKVKTHFGGFYWLEDQRVDRVVPEIELFDNKEDCIKKAISWNDAIIKGYKSEINHIVRINKKLEEQLKTDIDF